MPSIKKFDICVARPKGNPNDGVWWHRIGTASENDRGQISLFFNSLPFADKEGRCGAMLFEQKERDDAPQRSSSSSRRQPQSMDDDVPF